MTTRFETVKKIASLVAMASVVTAVGLGLGTGTAQAKPKPGPGPVCCSLPGQPSDKKSDRVFGEGTFSDFFQDVFVTGER